MPFVITTAKVAKATRAGNTDVLVIYGVITAIHILPARRVIVLEE
jgi:hypothetical protein